MAHAEITCWIYRAPSRGETYLYLPAEDATDDVPQPLLQHLGALELVMQLQISPARKLARADPVEVIRSLSERGYYLQLPPLRTPADGPVQ